MSLKKRTSTSTEGSYRNDLERLLNLIDGSDALVIGAGAGLSTSAGFVYGGERFHENFADFEERYGIKDMYTGGFYPFPTPEVKWAFWSRMVYLNRYTNIPGTVYSNLLALVKDTNYFVITTNVDHCFQKTGFDKRRLFYTQGDYGLFQCSLPCHKATYDNERQIMNMLHEQKDMSVPAARVPHCPRCGREMAMNLRIDDTFVEDEGWHEADRRYGEFLRANRFTHTTYLELGVGFNTPGIIKYPFWQKTLANPNATYVCINMGECTVPTDIQDRSIAISGDIGGVVSDLLALKKERTG